jgi:hypothetical protein
VVDVDEDAASGPALEDAIVELRNVAAIREAWVVRLT